MFVNQMYIVDLEFIFMIILVFRHIVECLSWGPSCDNKKDSGLERCKSCNPAMEIGEHIVDVGKFNAAK